MFYSLDGIRAMYINGDVQTPQSGIMARTTVEKSTGRVGGTGPERLSGRSGDGTMVACCLAEGFRYRYMRMKRKLQSTMLGISALAGSTLRRYRRRPSRARSSSLGGCLIIDTGDCSLDWTLVHVGGQQLGSETVRAFYLCYYLS